jgi:hypothetical protein
MRLRSWTLRLLALLTAVAVLLFLAALGYELVEGTRHPIRTLARRGDTALRHVGVLPDRFLGSYEKGTGGASFGRTSPTGEFVKTSEYVTSKEPSYGLGIWPVGMQVSVREIDHEGPLSYTGYRLVWWLDGERHVVDTADRGNGRLPIGATSVEVRGWIPFEAARWGIEKQGGGEAPADDWREDWNEGHSG